MKYMSLLFLIFLSVATQAKEIALTFDDAPRIANGYFDGPTRAKMLIESLAKMKVKEVAFFAVSSGLDDEGQDRLNSYARAGHIIANHTHSHSDYNKTNISDYIHSFKSADAILSKFPNFERWFRFPFLREGDQPDKRDAMRVVLDEFEYKNAYITINNYDWYIDDQFQKQIKEKTKLNFSKLKAYYIDTLLKAVEYYDDMANKYLGRSPKHIILLHETDINALFIRDFVAALESKGWHIISPREAYKDSISNYVTPNIFKFNPGRIAEIARDKGQKQGLWHETCDEDYLDAEFKRQVLQ